MEIFLESKRIFKNDLGILMNFRVKKWRNLVKIVQEKSYNFLKPKWQFLRVEMRAKYPPFSKPMWMQGGLKKNQRDDSP